MNIWDHFTKYERERIVARYGNNPPLDPTPGPSGCNTNPPPDYPRPPLPGHKLNADQTVAVATDVFWNEDMTACPRGCKLQLLGAGGVASYGSYHGDPFWVGWAPVPKRRKV